MSRGYDRRNPQATLTMFASSPFRLVRLLPVLLLAAAGIAAPVSAQDPRVAGVAVPEQTWLAGEALHLNGSGVRRIFGFRVYVAALYLPEPTHAPSQILERDQPRRLQVTLLRDASAEQHLEALRKGLLANNSTAELEALKPELSHFEMQLHHLRDVPAGTVIQLDYQPGMGTHIRSGDHDLGVFPGERFNRALLKIWLGDNPIQLSLKQSLLGLEAPTL
jgi:hypothetical protein